ncbi:MAG: YafY family protein [Spirochaetales bacterium]|nr:YafY family protein [Spirochaetales bacterium]
MKIDRLISILLIIIDKKKVTSEELARTFEVSVRTIQRDIDSLCSAGVPIYGEVGKNGGYHITENYKLDKNYISPKEVSTLVDILNGFKDTLYKDSIRDIMNKFSLFNEDSLPRARKVFIDTKPWGQGERQNSNLDKIYRAVEENLHLEFDYTDINKNITRRKVEPYTIIMKGNSWYLYAYSTLRSDYRLFNISRILNIELGETFEPRSDIQPIEDIQIEKQRKTTDMLLRTKSPYPVPGYLNPLEEKTDGEGYRVIKCSNPLDEWLYSALISLSTDFEVIEPPFIREEIVKRLKKCMNNYQL